MGMFGSSGAEDNDNVGRTDSWKDCWTDLD